MIGLYGKRVAKVVATLAVVAKRKVVVIVGVVMVMSNFGVAIMFL